MKLYELALEIEALLADETVLDEFGALTEEGEKQLDALSGDFEARVLDIACYARGERCEADAVSAEAHRLLQRAARHERRAESLERYLARHLTPGSQRIADARVEVYWHKGPPYVEITDAKALPKQFWRYPQPPPAEPDKVALSKALKAGPVNGAVRHPGRYSLKVK